MTERVRPGTRRGSVRAPSSKSQAHRLLIAAALSEHETAIRCDDLSADITATVACLNALGAEIVRDGEMLRVSPVFAALHAENGGQAARQAKSAPIDEMQGACGTQTETADDAASIPADKAVSANEMQGACACGTQTETADDAASVPADKAVSANEMQGACGAQAEAACDAASTANRAMQDAGGERILRCGESGSTLRFLLPLCGALGVSAAFEREGRLPERPLKPLDEQLTAHGMAIQPDGALLHVSGTLCAGEYTLPGNVSSQYVTGLLMALPLIKGESVLRIEGKLESADYVAMTLDTLEKAGIRVEAIDGGFRIPGGQRYDVPAGSAVEGDYSGAAFFLCMGALSKAGVTVTNLDPASKQGDKRVSEILARLGARVEYSADSVTVRRGSLRGAVIDASMIPDLVPALSAVAALCEGETRFTHAERLRLKESDRLTATKNLIAALGGDARENADGLIVTGKAQLSGGTVDPCGDHRLAMAAAVAACGCAGEVVVPDAQCVGKSYPAFWNDMKRLEVE